jgi:uncharacterized membrane protein YfcA
MQLGHVPLSSGASVFLLVAGTVTGFVDSIAGGGGLVSLPSLSLVLGPGVDAIGTNKIAGFGAALIALVVYAWHGHVDWRRSITFTVATGLGAFLGSRLAPLMPVWLFPWLLAATCPVILYIVWNKDLWSAREVAHESAQKVTHASISTSDRNSSFAMSSLAAVVAAGFICGLYDGMWGPGSGTFMFLALLFIVRLPLLASLAAAKLANTASAVTSLVSYAAQGHVHVIPGLIVAAGTLVGGYVGAHQANRQASRIVRPVLAVVVTLLVIKLLVDGMHSPHGASASTAHATHVLRLTAPART